MWVLDDVGIPTARLTSLPFPPVVCYQSNRDELRRRIIQWLEAEIIPDGWFSKGSNYSEILDKYFKVILRAGVKDCSAPEKGVFLSRCLITSSQIIRKYKPT